MQPNYNMAYRVIDTIEDLVSASFIGGTATSSNYINSARLAALGSAFPGVIACPLLLPLIILHYYKETERTQTDRIECVSRAIMSAVGTVGSALLLADLNQDRIESKIGYWMMAIRTLEVNLSSTLAILLCTERIRYHYLTAAEILNEVWQFMLIAVFGNLLSDRTDLRIPVEIIAYLSLPLTLLMQTNAIYAYKHGQAYGVFASIRTFAAFIGMVGAALMAIDHNNQLGLVEWGIWCVAPSVLTGEILSLIETSPKITSATHEEEIPLIKRTESSTASCWQKLCKTKPNQLDIAIEMT